jgi:UbiD family decarboxylase
VRRVSASVDRVGELAAIARTVQMEVPERQRYGLLFDNVQGADFPAAIGVAGFSRAQVETWIGMPYHARLEAWAEALDRTIPTTLVDSGPVRENVLQGAAIDLTRIPFPWWSPDQEGGPYHTNGIIVTRDPDTGVQNAGIYRMMLIDERRATITINPNRGGQHGGMMMGKFSRRGERTPVAVAIGCHPLIHMLGGAAFPYGVDEVTVAASLMGRSVDVVRCITSDIEVPADAEMVLEGWIDPSITAPEGPWGESAGYQEEGHPTGVFHVEAISHRDGAIYHGWHANQLPAEAGVITATISEAQLYRHLTRAMRFATVQDVAVTQGSSTINVIIKARPTYNGFAKQLLASVASYSPAAYKNIVLVDDDIDVHDPLQVEWAIAYRVQPHRDLTIIENLPRVHQDLSTGPGNWRAIATSKLLIDATKKWEYPAATRLNPDHLAAAKARWPELGLPPLI